MAQTRKGEPSAVSDTEEKKKSLCSRVDAVEKQRLFNELIVPHMNDVYTLSQRYTDRAQDVDANYNYALSNLYNYIASYDPSKPLHTWIHIVTKRACFAQNKRQAALNSHYTDIEMCSMSDLHQHGTSNVVDAGFGSLLDNVSDNMHDALMQIPPIRLSPFLLHAQGYGVRDIAKMEFKAGHIDRRSEDLVKSRIYWAKKELKYIFKKYGITAKNYTGKGDD